MCRKRKRDQGALYQPGRFDCSYCRRSVRGETHLRHTAKEDLSMCTDCYTEGIEVQGAKWTADQCKVIDTAASGRPLLVEDWLADQEVGLLDGILQYGFGNWRAVAEHMGGDKTEQMCEEHYERFYLRSKDFPNPVLDGPPQPAVAPPAEAPAAAPPAAATGKANVEKRGASGMIFDGQNVAPADLVGYMPLRGEYDTEWQDDAELQICEIEITGDELPHERAEKLTALISYNKQLTERQRRRDFVQQHDLQERMARHHALDRRLSREERLFRTQMRPVRAQAGAHPHAHTRNH